MKGMNYIMQILNTDKKSVLMGSGYLYAVESKDFDAANYNVNDMVEIGYIQENAVLRRTTEAKEITSANYGTVAVLNGAYTNEFETGIISYDAENVSRFLTGSQVTTVDGNIKRTYFCESDKHPTISLIFKGIDEDTQDEFIVVMPRAVWVGDYELDFNNDNPISLNYLFKLLNSQLPNGKNGAFFIDEKKAEVAVETK